MTNKLIVYTGIPGSGKSSHAKKLAILEDAVVIESDYIRETMFDNKQGKEVNTKLFEYIHEIILERLEDGNSVILDATNLNYKYRMSLLQKVKNLDVWKVAHVMATDFETCHFRNGNRTRVVPFETLRRMWMSFTMPQYYEGFDEIALSYSYDKSDYTLQGLERAMTGFNQDNPHHTRDLGEHTAEVVHALWGTGNDAIRYAGLFHDVGKLYTKSFTDSKGNPSDTAHYFSHENLSAYEAIFYLLGMGWKTEEIVYTCGLIQNHMRIKGCTTEKAKKKLIGLVGEQMYADLLLLNEADNDGK
ncbi:MAG: ATP-binding protein [Microgenomates group bacterium]